MEDSVPFASREYFIFLVVLMVSRGADFLSTWVATPHLVLEGNPIAKKLGWRLGILLKQVEKFATAFEKAKQLTDARRAQKMLSICQGRWRGSDGGEIG